jgi:L-ascorbate metabolism protein UlaG (beta-lactamase superfamily)
LKEFDEMATQLTWLGHGTWLIETEGHKILLDPYLDENPKSPIKADEVETDVILISHGHSDHMADTAAIAKRTGARTLCIYEIALWLEKNQGVQNITGMNLGGSVNLPFGMVKLVKAHHSSMLPDGSYGGEAGGFLLKLADGNIYFACDTALFYDMKLIASPGIALAVLPIGDLFTMGPNDSLEAIKLIDPVYVAADHCNTWPGIEQDVSAWADTVRKGTTAKPLVLDPGGKITLEGGKASASS